MKRRDAIKIVGVTGALAAGGCVQRSAEKIIPYLNAPEDVIPGKPTWYATTCRECPAGCGMRVKTIAGRPIKAEGNPDHPINRGALCPLGQASIQGLYHPDRFRGPMAKKDGKFVPISWNDALNQLGNMVARLYKDKRSDRIAMITGSISDTLAGIIDSWLLKLSTPDRLTYEALGYEAQCTANKISFGLGEIPALRIDKAEYVLSFGSDFLDAGPSPVESARQLASARAGWGKGKARFISFDSRLSLTAANADEWIPVAPGAEGLIAMAMINAIVSNGWAKRWTGDTSAFRDASRAYSPEDVAKAAGVPSSRIVNIARDFVARPGIALAGQTNAEATDTWLAVNLLNMLAGNINNTFLFGTGAGSNWATYADIQELIGRMQTGPAHGGIDLLLFYGVNPVSTLPGGDKFAEAMKKVELVVSFASGAG